VKNYSLILFVIFCSCTNNISQESLFQKVSPYSSGLNFVNNLEYTEELNPYTYRNFYNGGGIGIGDINNDSLPDIFFSGNLVSNKLFLNQGGLNFKDISSIAGIESEGVWSTGVSMVDINADGLLDIYVCKSGPPEGKRRYNELFINNGDLTFSEMAKDYGLDNKGLSTHAAFFDYDNDGDLDCYLLNNTIKSIGIGFDLVKGQRKIPDELGGNKLLRNDDNFFVDVSESAGIYTSKIGFGLGVTIGDINLDGWQDMFISNDFFEKDYLYINNKDGTFSESLEDYMNEISMGSMGADMADINNDGFSEIFVTEMLPKRHDRLMSKAVFDSWDKYQFSLNQGYFHQFSRNALQLNNQNGSFSDISRITGVDATDWSWGALIFDMDNDGLKDIFVANGIYKDLLDQDYVNFLANPSVISNLIKSEDEPIMKLIDMMPSEALPNFAFKNNGNLSFENVTHKFGFDEPTFSNGSAYSDLDNDGDLDIVLNNVNMESLLYENKTNEILTDNNFISFSFNSSNKNRFGIGTKVFVYSNNVLQYQELSPMRGFQSSVDYRLIFGLDNFQKVDSVKIIFPKGETLLKKNLEVNKHYIFSNPSQNTENKIESIKKSHSLLKEKNYKFDFKHNENSYVDFDVERLLFKMNSNEGPCLCRADFDKNDLDDFFVGGAKGQSSLIYFQRNDGSFYPYSQPFSEEKNSEDVDCLVDDFNGDGIIDIYVASGGSEFSDFSTELLDRIYFGDKNGKFHKSNQMLPSLNKFEITSTVSSTDFDEDGDVDIFVGVRLNPRSYGTSTRGYLLQNDGEGIFTDVTEKLIPELMSLGMVTDSEFVDLNNDNKKELIIVGEWMPVRIWEYINDSFMEITDKMKLEKSNGLYNVLKVSDLNDDGFDDIVLGNFGQNSSFDASEKMPMVLLVNDFDKNGRTEQILGMHYNSKLYPMVQLKDLWMQIPDLKKKYLKFENYKDETLFELFDEKIIEDSELKYVHNLSSLVLINNGGQDFTKIELPFEAQISSIYAILEDDFNDDNFIDIIIGGNQTKIKPEYGINNASFSLMLLGNNDGTFKPQKSKKSGLFIKGEIRDIIKIGGKNIDNYIFALNNDSMKIYNK